MRLNLFGYRFAETNMCRFWLALTITSMTLAMNARAQPSEYREAPQLAELVTAGELPPVEERLPQNPLVVPVVERTGEYGGTWRTALVGGADAGWMVRTIGYDYLLRWNPEWTEVIPNIAESFERNEEGTAYTFRLREGMGWSDGAPFTADDIMFWYEDVLMNPELTPVIPSWLTSGGEPVVVEKIDDYTVVFSFASPHGLFLQLMATPSAAPITAHPRHYLEQFHVSHNPAGIDDLMQQFGVGEWVDLFENRAQLWNNAELPRLTGWVITTAYGESPRVVAERNPYYWKIDPEGNQLPYIDRVVYDLIEDREVLVLRALAGEINMMDRHLH